eukprot:3030759-Rhodomonas_salina.1
MGDSIWWTLSSITTTRRLGKFRRDCFGWSSGCLQIHRIIALQLTTCSTVLIRAEKWRGWGTESTGHSEWTGGCQQR